MKSEKFHPRENVQIYQLEDSSLGLHSWLDSYGHNLSVLQSYSEEDWIPGRLQEFYPFLFKGFPDNPFIHYWITSSVGSLTLAPWTLKKSGISL